jgi:hypothetical protein
LGGRFFAVAYSCVAYLLREVASFVAKTPLSFKKSPVALNQTTSGLSLKIYSASAVLYATIIEPELIVWQDWQ